MRERGITQEQLAEIVGVGQPQISRILKGERGTDVEVIKRIAQALGESQKEYVFMFANLPNERTNDALILRVEHYLEEFNKQEQEIAERMIESIRPSKPKKSSNKQGV